MTSKNQSSKLSLKATPEEEDFRGKYESGKLGNKLLDGYFKVVEELTGLAKINTKNAKAIEIGCGEGLSTKRLLKQIPNNIELEASEYVAHQIPFAKKNSPDLKVTEESIYELKHKDKKFDLVYLLEVMEHLDYPDKALQEVKRAVKPGGYLIVGVPREPLWRSLNVARGKYWNSLGNTPGHLNNWSSNGITKVIEKDFGKVISVKKPLPWTLLLARKPK